MDMAFWVWKVKPMQVLKWLKPAFFLKVSKGVISQKEVWLYGVLWFTWFIFYGKHFCDEFKVFYKVIDNKAGYVLGHGYLVIDQSLLALMMAVTPN